MMEIQNSLKNKRKVASHNNSFKKMQTLVSQRKSMKASMRENEEWAKRKNKLKSIKGR